MHVMYGHHMPLNVVAGVRVTLNRRVSLETVNVGPGGSSFLRPFRLRSTSLSVSFADTPTRSQNLRNPVNVTSPALLVGSIMKALNQVSGASIGRSGGQAATIASNVSLLRMEASSSAVLQTWT